jgi:hypothetical protein
LMTPRSSRQGASPATYDLSPGDNTCHRAPAAGYRASDLVPWSIPEVQLSRDHSPDCSDVRYRQCEGDTPRYRQPPFAVRPRPLTLGAKEVRRCRENWLLLDARRVAKARGVSSACNPPAACHFTCSELRNLSPIMVSRRLAGAPQRPSPFPARSLPTRHRPSCAPACG